MKILEKYFAQKSKLGLAFNAVVVLLAVLIMIPQTRKVTTSMMLKMTIFVYQPTLLAKPIPLQDGVGQWQLCSLKGDTCRLSDFAGKVTIINYWASWCPPCVAEMGQFEQLYADYSDKVNFLFISNEKRSDIVKFQKRKNLNLPIYQAVKYYPQQLSSNTLPVTFLIDAEGNIMMRKSGIAQWNGQKMRKILDAMIAKSTNTDNN